MRRTLAERARILTRGINSRELQPRVTTALHFRRAARACNDNKRAVRQKEGANERASERAREREREREKTRPSDDAASAIGKLIILRLQTCAGRGATRDPYFPFGNRRRAKPRDFPTDPASN